MNKKYLIVMSLAMGLPTSILAISYFVYKLIEKETIGIYSGAAIIVLYISSILILMVKSAKSKSNKS